MKTSKALGIKAKTASQIPLEYTRQQKNAAEPTYPTPQPLLWEMSDHLKSNKASTAVEQGPGRLAKTLKAFDEG